jgi:hypothetical protein
MALWPPPWTWVHPSDGSLHVVADEEGLRTFNSQHIKGELRNVRHHVGLFTGNGESHHVNGWMILPKVQWLQRRKRTEYVPVLGGIDLFMQNVHLHRESVDMPFTRKKLLEHLAHARKNGPTLKGFLSKFDWQVVAKPDVPLQWLQQAPFRRQQPEAESTHGASTITLPNYGGAFGGGAAPAASGFHGAFLDGFELR